MRFLPPVAALANGLIHFDGDARSHERPVGPVISALENLGVTIEHGDRYSLPLTINGSGAIKGGVLEIDASASSQFISALLLIGPATQIGITVKDIGISLPSLPHIEMTIAMLKKFGAQVETKINENGKREWRVEPGALLGQDLVIEPDLSNAAPFMAAAMISGGEVLIADWPKSTAQPGDQLRNIFAKMGAKIEFIGTDLKISGTGKIHGIDIVLHDVGELTPSIAAVAALATELNALGGDVDEEESALHISPAPLHSGIFHTYDDHRLATAGAMLGLVINGIEVENIATTQKTLPDFPGAWQAMLNSNLGNK
jgi:3-phosphoshikimate 1-carboxyvinyltransferase